jgi:uncharacterized protein YajQ (UPF0234 family)
MNVTINILELASELADKELREKWDFRDGQADVDDGHGGVIYSETSQDIFNLLYDEYYAIIDQIKQ